MIALVGKNFIAGELSPTASADAPPQSTFEHFNPRTRQPNPLRFPNATPAEIDAAVQAAQQAYQITRSLPAATLAELLERIAQEIEALGDQLLETADAETALGLPRLTGERGRTTGQLRAFAALLHEGSYVEAIIDPALPDRQPAPRPDIRRMLFPIGPVAVFSASNFP
ncbi:MAG TPA: aldehyde dehydrogenase family protein, partial [Phototrophicaceae bacterium]|nr:aldehyde dehydrogenase family protein [Phototrophicaceae bacterium]